MCVVRAHRSPVDTSDRAEVLRLIRSVIGTKMMSKWCATCATSSASE